MHSFTEENYIKTIYKLSADGTREVSTNALADALLTKPASVTDMLRKLSGKNVINYVKYKGVSLTQEGRQVALRIVRKHRLWEVFLVDKLNFNWDEVHDVAEELEHVDSDLLIKRLDEFLGFPQTDPHGDPIPTEDGQIKKKQQMLVADMPEGAEGFVMGVKDSNPLFLQHLDRLGIHLGAAIQVLSKADYDNSLEIKINHTKKALLSSEVSRNIYITA